ncbi:MAG: EAL and HDOD domain-containing protein [Thermodesulfobacteriota bacterium]
METFIARQPIFDLRQKVYGYELLFRSGLDNIFKNPDPNQATSKVIVDSFFLMDLSTLTGGKKAFINIPRDILLNEYVFLVPKELIVAEILETVKPDADVIRACEKLKGAGYLLAMDDFVYDDIYRPLVELADFIKVDFLSTAEDERRSLIQKLHPLGKYFLAEKVETPEVLQEASSLGYTYFQGYYFSKPTILSQKDIPAYKLHYLQILREIHRPELDFRELERIIKQEVSLSFRLLRYINSAFFGLRNKVTSILQAIVLLGEKEIKKWVSLITLANMGQDKADELVVLAIIRARFCESLTFHIGLRHRSEDLFLMGMLSLIDAILGQPLSDILKEIPIPDDIKKGLLGEENRFHDIYQYVLAFERGDWNLLSERAAELGVDEAISYQLYFDAIHWGYRCFLGEEEG